MLIEINFKSGMPVYLQVVDQIRAAAASGQLRPGDPLPSIRPLAMQLRVNRNTIAKAYTELETQGLIETVAGKGCFIKNSSSPFRKQVRDQMLVVEIDQAVVAAHHLGVKRNEFLGLVNERLDAFEERAAAARAKEN